MAVFIDLRPQLKHIRLLYIFIGILVCTASFKGCHSGKLGEFNGHRTVPVDINNRYKKATSNGMDCYVTGTVPGVGDCTIKVTESAYDEAKKKGKYQRLYFDLYGSEYMSSGWLLPVLLLAAAEFTYRGHSYIWFHHPGGWDGNDGIVHNPDCKCSKK